MLDLKFTYKVLDCSCWNYSFVKLLKESARKTVEKLDGRNKEGPERKKFK
jgi:hypothetical protein